VETKLKQIGKLLGSSD